MGLLALPIQIICGLFSLAFSIFARLLGLVLQLFAAIINGTRHLLIKLYMDRGLKKLDRELREFKENEKNLEN